VGDGYIHGVVHLAPYKIFNTFFALARPDFGAEVVFNGLLDDRHRHLNSYISNATDVRKRATLECLWRVQSKK
jgi:hypothetical protein